jgi:hypothetical protein
MDADDNRVKYSLWGGRFSCSAIDTVMKQFNQSILIDKRLYKEDIWVLGFRCCPLKLEIINVEMQNENYLQLELVYSLKFLTFNSSFLLCRTVCFH